MLEIPLLQKAPFRYVDEVEFLDAASCSAVLSLHLSVTQHRWSGTKALPGYLLIEAMAQAAGVLLRHLTVGEPGGFLVSVDKARLPDAVKFPAKLRLPVKLMQSTPPLFSFIAKVHCADESIAQAEISVMAHRRFA